MNDESPVYDKDEDAVAQACSAPLDDIDREFYLDTMGV